MMREAAALLDSKAAMQIRYLETISMLGSSGSTKIVLLPDTPDVRM
jgi:regulator of protease activity HflC (stomatin/prohibitin superfamily)